MGSMLAVTLAVAVLALTTTVAPGASLRIFWRYAVLSFDNPATQLFDELVFGGDFVRLELDVPVPLDAQRRAALGNRQPGGLELADSVDDAL